MVTVTQQHAALVRNDRDIVEVRQVTRRVAAEVGFSIVDQTKLVTAASELARNAVVHGGGGTAKIEVLKNGVRTGVRLTFEDQGPGIPDLELALRDGYTTGNGLGLGLAGSRRLVNEFAIATRVGEGTRVTAIRWR